MILVVDSFNGDDADGRVTFAGYLYDSGGNRLTAREPLTGYERNFGTNLNRSAHHGVFLLNMTSAGSVGLRAKIYEQEPTSTTSILSHSTEAGGFILVEKLGGGQRGQEGAAGSITAVQQARLLPTLPASGSRDNRIPKFNGDTLGWETDLGGVQITQTAYDALTTKDANIVYYIVG